MPNDRLCGCPHCTHCRKLSDKRVKRMVAALKAGKTTAEVAKEHGLTTARVTVLVRDHIPLGFWTLRRPVGPKAPGRESAIVAAYMRGEKLGAIAKDHRISVSRVSDILNRAAFRARESVDLLPDAVAEAKDWRRAIFEYAAREHARDPGMRERRAKKSAEEREAANRARRNERKATKPRQEQDAWWLREDAWMRDENGNIKRPDGVEERLIRSMSQAVDIARAR